MDITEVRSGQTIPSIWTKFRSQTARSRRTLGSSSLINERVLPSSGPGSSQYVVGCFCVALSAGANDAEIALADRLEHDCTSSCHPGCRHPFGRMGFCTFKREPGAGSADVPWLHVAAWVQALAKNSVRIRLRSPPAAIRGNYFAVSISWPRAPYSTDAMHDHCGLRSNLVECPQESGATVVHGSFRSTGRLSRPVVHL